MTSPLTSSCVALVTTTGFPPVGVVAPVTVSVRARAGPITHPRVACAPAPGELRSVKWLSSTRSTIQLPLAVTLGSTPPM